MSTTSNALTLSFPRYSIVNACFEGRLYSVTQTCSIDTGLYALYYVYKTASDIFRLLFDLNTTPCHINLRKTFQLVDSDGWDTARLHWLVSHKLLGQVNSDGMYDIKDTITANVFQFVEPLQMYMIKTECLCIACPKPVRFKKNHDISLT
jgi:hypothetical protein